MVWSTTQSAMYSRDDEDDLREEDCGTEPCPEEPPRREAPPRDIPRGECPQKPANRGLLEDSDTLIILALIMLLMREKVDSKLIFALLLVIL